MTTKAPRYFFVLILLPLLLTTLGTTFVSLRMLNGISEAVDRQEMQRSWEAVNSAFGSAGEKLSALIIDNARWDDAAEHTANGVDQQWVFDNWGTTTSDPNYDTMFVISPQGEVLSGFHNGKVTDIDPSSYYGGAFRRLISATPALAAHFRVITSLAWTRDGLAVVSAAPIIPYSPENIEPERRYNKLVISRTIGPLQLAKLSRQYVVDDLKVHPLAAGVKGAVPIFDNWGAPVATVTWRARNPGDAARSSYTSLAFSSVIAMILVLLPISIVHARAMRRLHANERREREAARRDSLSDLPNRLSLSEKLHQELAASHGLPVSLLFIDLDGFKTINDAYDHETGDRLIRAIAAGLKVLAGETHFVSRLGGDEFGILMVSQQARMQSEELARRILEFVKEPFEVDGRVAAIGASIGISDNVQDVMDPNELMRRADIAMYDAKERGGNCFRRFVPALDTRRNENLEIASELRGFIEKGVIGIAFQPIVDANTQAVIGVEALARWPDHSRRMIGPERFIAVAEEFGLIGSLSNLLLRKACAALAGRPDLNLSVNISPLQVGDARFVPDLLSTLEHFNFPCSQLEIELTEGVLVKNPNRTRTVIKDLRQNGIVVSLDDFGAGYASIGYLRDFEFDKVKLDRTLTQAIAKDAAVQKIVQGTVLIARGMSASIVAEGVETAEQASLMRLAGCDLLQGYYFGRPSALLPGARPSDALAQERRALLQMPY